MTNFRDEDEQWEMPAAPVLSAEEIEIERKISRRQEIDFFIRRRENIVDSFADGERLWSRSSNRIRVFVSGDMLQCVHIDEGMVYRYQIVDAALTAESRSLIAK